MTHSMRPITHCATNYYTVTTLTQTGNRRMDRAAGRTRCSKPLRRDRNAALRRALRLGLCILLLAATAGSGYGWEIGHRTLTWQDPARGGRSIQTEVYYPADLGGEGVPVGGDGSVLFPAVVFGHGYLMTVDAYAFLWEGLVPAGYIVALPRTEGNLLPDHEEFGLDLAFLADQLRAETELPGSFLHQRVAPEAAVAGHSMGGGASILAASGSSTITAVFNFAAANTNPSAIAAAPGVTAWTLMLSGSVDCVAPPEQHQIPIHEALGSDCRTHVTLTGASHCQFAASNFYCNLGEGGCSPPTITRAQQQALTLALVYPWLAARLRNDPAGWSEFQDLLASHGGITWEQDCAVASAPDLAGDPRAPDPRSGDGDSAGHRDPVRPPQGRFVIPITVGPNPFRPAEELTAALGFRLARAKPDLELMIFAADGRCVRTLCPTYSGATGARGEHAVNMSAVWDGRDGHGLPLPSGIYYARALLSLRDDPEEELPGEAQGSIVLLR